MLASMFQDSLCPVSPRVTPENETLTCTIGTLTWEIDDTVQQTLMTEPDPDCNVICKLWLLLCSHLCRTPPLGRHCKFSRCWMCLISDPLTDGGWDSELGSLELSWSPQFDPITCTRAVKVFQLEVHSCADSIIDWPAPGSVWCLQIGQHSCLYYRCQGNMSVINVSWGKMIVSWKPIFSVSV